MHRLLLAALVPLALGDYYAPTMTPINTLRVINTVKLKLLSVFLGSSAADYLSRRTPKGAYSFGLALFALSEYIHIHFIHFITSPR